jgi:tRNA pseudouridine38-40 synthase
MEDTLKFKFVIAYDGSGYSGWQTQKSGVGVQQKVEAALASLFSGDPRLHSSSRTDTGVHALGMVAHVELPRQRVRMTPEKMLLAVNAHLPPDIRVQSVCRCSAEFHARFDATGKQYRYFVWNHNAANPLLLKQTWQVPQPLDLAAMRQAARQLVGRHDFRSFAANRNYPTPDTVRTLFRCDIKRQGPLLTFIIEGGGFLYKMCRGIAGTLVQVGQGKIAPEEILNILASKDRRVAGMTAPAHGLVLWKVLYGGSKTAKAGREATPTTDEE